MFTNNLIAGASGQQGFYDFPIEQSLRFNDDDSAYLSRTPASAGNRKTWTWSGWVKRGNLDNYQVLFGAGTNTSNRLAIRLSLDSLSVFEVSGGSTQYNVVTSAVLRDVSAWYHIVVSYDTTEATSSDRIKMYLNGTQQTDMSVTSYPSLNYDGYVNLNTPHLAGVSAGAVQYFDGYQAEVNFIDGQALDPTDFGEFKSGVWIPKRYGGTYGTNGFRLSFADSSNIGDDTSGNANDWTANSLVATDVLLDSPTNNFAVLNPLKVTSSGVFSEGNLTASVNGASNATQEVHSTVKMPSSGKWYFEAVPTVLGDIGIGLFSDEIAFFNSRIAVYIYNGEVLKNGSSDAFPVTTYTTGDVVGVAVDVDAATVAFYKNNTLIYTATSVSHLSQSSAGFAQLGSSGSCTAKINFGQDSSFAGNKPAQGNTDDNGIGDFYYAPPSGYLALCTANLPDPVIDPAKDDVPSDYFNTVLYTGNGGTQSIDTGGVNDLTWIKMRNSVGENYIWDAVRGFGDNGLISNRDSAEGYNSVYYTITRDADGFDITQDGIGNEVNYLGNTYVSWNWKANGSGASNTDGSITSTVSVNQKAGFSIVSYTATSSQQSVGHGLSQTPQIVIQKDRDASSDWLTHYDIVDGSLDFIRLNTTGAGSNSSLTPPTSSVFTSAISVSGRNVIAYCFHSVEGYSKFGSYTGNGSTDGPMIWTGHRPAWIMVKRTDSTSNWIMFDDKRLGYNPDNNYVYADLSNGDGTADLIDLISNGFKIRSTSTAVNTSGGTYIYMAFAENPFKYANAR